MTIDNNIFTLTPKQCPIGKLINPGWAYSVTRYDGKILTGWIAEGRLEFSLKRISDAINNYQHKQESIK